MKKFLLDHELDDISGGRSTPKVGGLQALFLIGILGAKFSLLTMFMRGVKLQDKPQKWS